MSPLLTEYYDRHDTPPTEPAKKILFAVLADVLDRSGFDHLWERCEEETQEEIFATNLENIQKAMRG